MILKTLAFGWTALEEKKKKVHHSTLNTLQNSKNAGFKLICVLQQWAIWKYSLLSTCMHYFPNLMVWELGYCLGCTVAKIMMELNICLGWEYPVEGPIVTMHLLLKLEPLAACPEYQDLSEYSQLLSASNTDRFIKLIFLELGQFITSF